MQQSIDAMKQLTATLADVHDNQSGKAAIPKIKEHMRRIIELNQKFKSLPVPQSELMATIKKNDEVLKKVTWQLGFQTGRVRKMVDDKDFRAAIQEMDTQLSSGG